MQNRIRFVTFVSCALLMAGALLAQKKSPPKDSPNLLLPPPEDVLRAWNDVGGKLIDMAQDFPENKYDFKVQQGPAHIRGKYSARIRRNVPGRESGQRDNDRPRLR